MQPKISKVFGGTIDEYEFKDLVTFYVDNGQPRIVSTTCPPHDLVQYERYSRDMAAALEYMTNIVLPE